MLRVLSVAADVECTVIRRGRTVLVLVSDKLVSPRAAALITRALRCLDTEGDDVARAS